MLNAFQSSPIGWPQFGGGILYTSTAPLPMRHTTMGYTSMRYTSMALYFYEENIQAPNNFF